MFSHASLSICIVALLSLFSLSHAHTVLTYPGWRGDNLHSNGTTTITNGVQPGTAPNGTGPYWPYGMQWTYPCGGMPMSQNRTKWPTKGGAVAFQPGWFQGHGTAYIYINIGFGNVPENYSNVMYQGLQIVGPTTQAYPGTFCLPQVPLPVNAQVKAGDNATIQVIETAVHGAALYNCVDITFEEPGHPSIAEVNSSNCFNSTQLKANLIFATSSLSGADATIHSSRYNLVGVLLAMLWAFVLV